MSCDYVEFGINSISVKLLFILDQIDIEYNKIIAHQRPATSARSNMLLSEYSDGGNQRVKDI